jgi:predicted XRE-type DNA-binding protein
MAKSRVVVAKNSAELADALGLTPADGMEIEFRSQINAKIVAVVKKRGLAHAQVAELAGISRTRITALLNLNSKDISTDLMLRVLGALGVVAKVSFAKVA